MFGISKRSCFACHHVLTHWQDVAVVHGATHGKVYPWAPPDGVKDNIKDTLLRLLQDHLLLVFEAIIRMEEKKPESDDSASETDWGWTMYDF